MFKSNIGNIVFFSLHKKDMKNKTDRINIKIMPILLYPISSPSLIAANNNIMAVANNANPIPSKCFLSTIFFESAGKYFPPNKNTMIPIGMFIKNIEFQFQKETRNPPNTGPR